VFRGLRFLMRDLKKADEYNADVPPLSFSVGGDGDGTSAFSSFFLFQVVRQAQFRGKRCVTHTHIYGRGLKRSVPLTFVSSHVVFTSITLPVHLLTLYLSIYLSLSSV